MECRRGLVEPDLLEDWPEIGAGEVEGYGGEVTGAVGEAERDEVFDVTPMTEQPASPTPRLPK